MNLTPRQIVEELDKYIIGQSKAKKAVSIALRNRYRRSQLPKEVREEITPKNIIMKGPTGVGKTEIARRLAKLVKAPFVKVEATKYTEVGYVGRDVESMVRDLVAVSVNMVKEEKTKEVEEKAGLMVANRICDILFKNQVVPEGEELKSKEAIKLDYFEGKFDKEIIENNETVIIDFWAPWCGPCRALGPMIEEISENHQDVYFGKVNVDNEEELASAFRVTSIPLVVKIRNKKVVDSFVGIKDRKFVEEFFSK